MPTKPILVIAGGFGLMTLVSLAALTLYRPKPPIMPLRDYGPAPEFQLTDEQNTPFASERLSGKVWVADFFFSSCPGPCPKMALNMAALQKEFSGRNDIHLVNFSVDPERDTPEVLREYGAKLHADPERWHFLTGAPEEIERIAVKGFLIGDAENLILHSQKFALVDRQGRIRGYYEGTDNAEMGVLARDIKRLLDE